MNVISDEKSYFGFISFYFLFISRIRLGIKKTVCAANEPFYINEVTFM